MRKELEHKLIARWPTWFNTGGDIRCTAMARGVEHGTDAALTGTRRRSMCLFRDAPSPQVLW